MEKKRKNPPVFTAQMLQEYADKAQEFCATTIKLLQQIDESRLEMTNYHLVGLAHRIGYDYDNSAGVATKLITHLCRKITNPELEAEIEAAMDKTKPRPVPL